MKLEDKELEKLRSLHEDMMSSKIELSETVVAIETLSSRKSSLISRCEISQSVLDDYQKEIVDKYSPDAGVKFRIDMTTGELISIG
jgi:hypothetical protein